MSDGAWPGREQEMQQSLEIPGWGESLWERHEDDLVSAAGF